MIFIWFFDFFGVTQNEPRGLFSIGLKSQDLWKGPSFNRRGREVHIKNLTFSPSIDLIFSRNHDDHDVQ
jgi:hypothetical protein